MEVAELKRKKYFFIHLRIGTKDPNARRTKEFSTPSIASQNIEIKKKKNRGYV